MSTFGKDSNFLCMHCPYEFSWDFQLQQHIKTAHTDTDIFHIFDSSLRPEEHRCEQCIFSDYDKVKLHNHIKEVHNKTPRPRRRKKLYYNKRKIPCRVYQSEHCDYTTNSCLVIIKHHYLMSTSNTGTHKRLGCEVCKQFEITFVLAQRFSSGEVWFKCSSCSYRSSIKPNLKRHIQSKHTYPERSAWFDCAECSYRCRLKSMLKKHMLWRHTDSEWLACSECSFRTKLHGEFAKHQHDLVVWFNCSECSFYCKHAIDGLIKHVALMHPPGDFRWNCLRCLFETENEVGLKRHMIDEHCKKTDTDWFACHVCSYSTAWEEEFVRHMRRHRPKLTKFKAHLGSPASGGLATTKLMLKQSGCSVLQRVFSNLSSK